MSPSPTAERASLRARSTCTAAADLERFWPSRREHAFDEFCR